MAWRGAAAQRLALDGRDWDSVRGMPRAILETTAWAWGWDTVAALGTLALALVTAWLAFSTRALAAASREDEEAQWRPVLVSDVRAPVAYDSSTGELSFDVRNVGRGPAFGVSAQLRSGKQALGASIPTLGTAVALAPTERFTMRLLTKPEEHTTGRVIQATLSWYDLSERVHEAVFTISAHVPPERRGDASFIPDLVVQKVLTKRTDRFLPGSVGRPSSRRNDSLTRDAKRRRDARTEPSRDPRLLRPTASTSTSH